MRFAALIDALVIAGLAAACGSSPKAAGDECVASSECGDGLVCDFGQEPPVCAGMGTVPIDGAPAPDADPTAADAAPAPDAEPGAPDAAPPDAAPPDAAPPDAAPPDAMMM